MRKYLIAAIVALFASQLSFAAPAMSTDTDDTVNKSCGLIAKACVKAGYAKKRVADNFWQGCMQPVLLNQTVKNVKVEASDVKACRDYKIAKMEKELEQLKAVS